MLEELNSLYDYLELLTAETNQKKAYKTALDNLHKSVIAKYAELTETEIKTLVVKDKWFSRIQASVESETQRIAQRLADRVKGLMERYAQTLPELEHQVEVCNAKVKEHLKQIGMIGHKQVTIESLLTGETRLPGFTGAWETKELGEIGDISGAGVDKKVKPNELPVRLVNYLDVYNKTFLYSNDLTHDVSARPDQVRRCAVEKGDIFFTPSSEVSDDIGCSAVAMENISDGVYSYHIVRLRLKTDWDLSFRAYIFNTKEFLDQASRQCEGGGTRYVISLPKFRAMTVRFPPTIEEQRAIGAVLSDMDAEITALEQRRDKTIAIKQGMMQLLLTGRVRLSESRIIADDTDDAD